MRCRNQIIAQALVINLATFDDEQHGGDGDEDEDEVWQRAAFMLVVTSFLASTSAHLSHPLC